MSTWLLLRGLTREARHWGALPDALRASNAVHSDDLLLTPDLPGNGVYANMRSPLDVAAMVAFARDDAKRSGARAPYRLLAMSLGGMVATAWAQRYPYEIERLVLINTSMRPYSRASDRLQRAAWPDLVWIARHWRNPHDAEARIHARTCNDQTTLAADLATWRAIRDDAPVGRANALCQLWAAARFRADDAAPACLVLILSSAGDRLVSPRCSAQLAHAWRAARVLHVRHPSAGHDLPHDAPIWVSEQIRAWLNATSSNDPLSGYTPATQ